MAEIRCSQLYKKFQNTGAILNAVDFCIQDGETIVLTGPSGSGKSTLLHMIAGLVEPTSGKIFVGNRQSGHIKPMQRNIAMSFQDPGLYPGLSAFDTIAISLKKARMPKAEMHALISDICDQLTITRYLNSPINTLPQGIKQLVSIAKALVRNPNVLLLDEPFACLDPLARSRCMEVIRQRKKQLNCPIILATKQYDTSMAMADKLMILNEGIIEQMDTASNCYRYPVNTFVASFFGLPPMNFVTGEVKRMGEEMGIVFGNQFICVPKSYYPVLEKKNAAKVVTVGFRPEHTSVILSGPLPPNNVFDVTVERVVFMGNVQHVYARLDNQTIIMSVQSNCPVVAGNHYKIGIFVDNISVFNVTSGLSLFIPPKTTHPNTPAEKEHLEIDEPFFVAPL